MVEEDGKFYPIMRVVHGEPETYEMYEYIYGKKLLEKRHPVLHKYLLREISIQESILRQPVSYTHLIWRRCRKNF